MRRNQNHTTLRSLDRDGTWASALYDIVSAAFFAPPGSSAFTMADQDVPSRVLQAQEYVFLLFNVLLIELLLMQIRNRSAKSFGEAHWFCPAHGDENGAVFDNPDEDDEDFTVAAKQERIKAAVERLKVVRDLFLVLGLGDEEIEQQNNFKQQLNEQLLRCFECNRKYHKSRESFLKQLEKYVIRRIQLIFKN